MLPSAQLAGPLTVPADGAALGLASWALIAPANVATPASAAITAAAGTACRRLFLETVIRIPPLHGRRRRQVLYRWTRSALPSFAVLVDPMVRMVRERST